MDKKIYQILVELVSDLTGNRPEDITPESHIQDDLGLDLEVNFAKLINAINVEFRQRDEVLQLDPAAVLEILSQYGETVGELTKIIEEELALG